MAVLYEVYDLLHCVLETRKVISGLLGGLRLVNDGGVGVRQFGDQPLSSSGGCLDGTRRRFDALGSANDFLFDEGDQLLVVLLVRRPARDNSENPADGLVRCA